MSPLETFVSSARTWDQGSNHLILAFVLIEMHLNEASSVSVKVEEEDCLLSLNTIARTQPHRTRPDVNLRTR